MSNFLFNLKPREEFCEIYFISSVSVGIQNALEHPDIKKCKLTTERLTELYSEIMQIPCAFRTIKDVDMSAIRKALLIQHEAYELVCDF